jgi:carbon-monoxide dehydrogenase iron sulfur subunit
LPRFLYVDPLECTGCRICEMYCAFQRGGALNPKKARVRVVREEPGIDKILACRQCADAACMKACPENAIWRDKMGVVRVDEKKCTGCGACTEACPFGAIWLHPDTKKAIKCDLCGFCVSRCPPRVLKIISTEELAAEKRRKIVERTRSTMLEGVKIPRR